MMGETAPSAMSGGSEIVAIYVPKGESIPLCTGHFEQIEQAVQERLAELK